MTSRRRWSYGLRTRLLGIALASVPLAWVGYSLHWIRQRHIAMRGNLGETGDDVLAPGGLWLLGEKGQRGLLIFLGDAGPEGRQARMAYFQGLFPEAWVLGLDESNGQAFTNKSPPPDADGHPEFIRLSP